MHLKYLCNISTLNRRIKSYSSTPCTCLRSASSDCEKLKFRSRIWRVSWRLTKTLLLSGCKWQVLLAGKTNYIQLLVLTGHQAFKRYNIPSQMNMGCTNKVSKCPHTWFHFFRHSRMKNAHLQTSKDPLKTVKVTACIFNFCSDAIVHVSTARVAKAWWKCLLQRLLETRAVFLNSEGKYKPKSVTSRAKKNWKLFPKHRLNTPWLCSSCWASVSCILWSIHV